MKNDQWQFVVRASDFVIVHLPWVICHLTENPCRRIFGLSSTDLCLSVFIFGFTLYVPGSASFLATFEGVRHLYGGMCG